MQSENEETLEASWEKVLSDWENEEAHRSFLESAALLNALPFAAQRYRGEEALDAHRERAQQQLNKITVQALSMLEATRSPTGAPNRAVTWVALMVSLSLVAASIFAMTR